MISSRIRWTSIFDDFASSGLTVRCFCERRGIAISTFYQRRRRLREGSALARRDSDFVEAVVESDAAGPSSVAPIIELRCGRRVVVPRGFDEATLASVVVLLEGLDSRGVAAARGGGLA